jgi:hypothetical protein
MWLLGEAGDESAIKGDSPVGERFLEYATGPRAGALLSVSLEWLDVPGTLVVGYEDLVRRPFVELSRLTRRLQPMPKSEVLRAVEACRIDRLRNRDNAPHFWQGKPEHWKRLLRVSLRPRPYPNSRRRPGELGDAHRAVRRGPGRGLIERDGLRFRVRSGMCRGRARRR